MSQFTIAEVARRSGLTTSALRYYDEVGLVRPVARTEAGYRVYDERAVERLAIITRAKLLGLTLADARAVADQWETGACADVQDLLRAKVAARLDATQRELAERMAHAAELQAAINQLSGPAPAGACDDDCACVAPTVTVRRGIAITPRAQAAGGDDDALCCTLPGSEMPDRMDQWQHVLAHVSDRVSIDGGVRLRFAFDADVTAELARLSALEHACCPFFTFAVTIDGGGVTLDVTAPPSAAPLVAAVFGVSVDVPVSSTSEVS